MNNVIGIDGAGPIWHDFMEEALAGQPAEAFPVPPNIVVQCVPAPYGMPANYPPPAASNCQHEVFVKGTEKTAIGQSIAIGGGAYIAPRAGSSTPASPNANVAGVAVKSEPAPTSPAPPAASPAPPSPAPPPASPAPAPQPPGQAKKH
jgi:hypothetical protein